MCCSLPAAGGANTDHAFRVESLPDLFEQLLIQLQDFPSPPIHYRPQTDEPSLDADQRVRIICGFSGAITASGMRRPPADCSVFEISEILR